MNAEPSHRIPRKIPGPLWIAIVTLVLMVAYKTNVAFSGNPLAFFDVLLYGVVLAGIVRGAKWAYVLTLVFSVLGTLVALSNGAAAGMTVFLLNCLIFVPLFVCTRYFFAPSPPQADVYTELPETRRDGFEVR